MYGTESPMLMPLKNPKYLYDSQASQLFVFLTIECKTDPEDAIHPLVDLWDPYLTR